MKIPTLARMIETFGTEQGTTAYRLMKYRGECYMHPDVVSWAQSCYHDPRVNPQAYGSCLMLALNAVLGTFGVEAIRGRHVDNYHGDIQAEYLNTGDTYAVTLLLDHERDTILITSWGDWVEQNERKRGLV